MFQSSVMRHTHLAAHHAPRWHRLSNICLDQLVFHFHHISASNSEIKNTRISVAFYAVFRFMLLGEVHFSLDSFTFRIVSASTSVT